MARLDVPGVLQHVIARGVERRAIFLDDQDRGKFLDRLSDSLNDSETLCYAWSLMPNHFHLLLLPTRFKLAVLMRRLLTGYAVSFNLLHHRVGHLFQNRYKSIVCDKETYLLELIRYIHLNPIRAGLVGTLEDLDRYPWSGHAVLMGNQRMEGQVVAEILQLFGKGTSKAQLEYRRFVAEGLSMGRRDDLVGIGFKRRELIESDIEDSSHIDSRILGDSVFANDILKNRTLREKARVLFPLSELVRKVCSIINIDPVLIRQPSKARSFSEARGIICYVGIRELGYKSFELGRELNLGASGVSIALRRGESLLRSEPGLQERIFSLLEK